MPSMGVTQRLSRSQSPGEQALSDTPSIDSINAPDVAVPGDTVTIGVSVRCLTIPGGACESAVRFEAGGDTVRRPASGSQQIGEASTHTFEASFQMPDGPLQIEVTTLESTTLIGFGEVETRNITINPVSREEKQRRDIIDSIIGPAPWVIGGGSLGAGAGYLTEGKIGPLPGALVGSGVGLGVHAARQQDAFPELDFPTIPVLATAALLGTGALLFSSSGISLGGAGGAARRVGRTAREKLPT